jgi:CRP/FNR family transcriptional regulator
MNLAQKIRVSDHRNVIVGAHGASAFTSVSPISSPHSPRGDDADFLDKLWVYGNQISLRPQQRVLLSDADEFVVLRDGLLAVDATPTKGKLQVLDFLVPGDIVTAPIIRRAPGLAVRAITPARIISLDSALLEQNVPPQDFWAFLFSRCQHQLVRTSLHQLMIGRLEIEPRVASFILALAYSYGAGHSADTTVSLPMSRADIANYLVINSDTLSRTMMKFAALGLIERMSRHNIRVLDIDGLRTRSPLARLLAAAPGDALG